MFCLRKRNTSINLIIESTADCITHQIFPGFFLIGLCLQLIQLHESFESTAFLISKINLAHERQTNVRNPSSVLSKNSAISSFVSSLKGSPFVSTAHFCRPSSVKYAFCGGTRRVVASDAFGTAGVQYFAKICFKQTSN